jgi:hypothetical protein
MEIKIIQAEEFYGKTMYIKDGKRYAMKSKFSQVFKNREDAVEKGKSIIRMKMNDLNVLMKRLER